MEWIIKTMQSSPELAIFLTLALGFAIGMIKIKGFGLGSVTGVLLMGVLIGQLHIAISPTVKTVFFLLFLFAVGYGVGPQFIRSLKKDGLPQIAFAVIVCVSCLLVSVLAAFIAGFDMGSAAGLLSGANTISAVIGVASDTINQLPIGSDLKQQYINNIPVAYAVTYIFGTAGTAWFLATIGPKILGGDVVQQTKEYEASLGGSFEDDDPTSDSVYNGSTFRVIEAGSEYFKDTKTIQDLENYLISKSRPIYVERLRTVQGEVIQEPALDRVIQCGDRLVLNGPIEAILADQNLIGKEVFDEELLDFKVETLKVIINNKKMIGTTINSHRKSKNRRGVFVRKMYRGDMPIPMLRNLKIERGDVVEIEGLKKDVERLAALLGHVERPTNVTDILYVALGVFLGGLLGSIVLHAGNVPLSLSASGGVLIMGILFGWLRSLRPTFGAIPQPAMMLMNTLGLNLFIAVVGINAGPSFVAGIQTAGLSLFVAGIFVSVVPMLIGLLVGKYFFKFPAAINLGACAGARTTTAAIGMIQESTKSKVPALSYTTTYAVGNTLLIIWGVVIILLMH